MNAANVHLSPSRSSAVVLLSFAAIACGSVASEPARQTEGSSCATAADCPGSSVCRQAVCTAGANDAGAPVVDDAADEVSCGPVGSHDDAPAEVLYAFDVGTQSLVITRADATTSGQPIRAFYGSKTQLLERRVTHYKASNGGAAVIEFLVAGSPVSVVFPGNSQWIYLDPGPGGGVVDGGHFVKGTVDLGAGLVIAIEAPQPPERTFRGFSFFCRE